MTSGCEMDCATDNRGILDLSFGFADKNWIGEIACQDGTAIFAALLFRQVLPVIVHSCRCVSLAVNDN